MTINKAIEHFKYKLNKVWAATPKDAEAISEIIKFTNQKHEQQIQANELFAKLYIMVFAQYIERYKTDAYDDIPQKELHKLLDKDLSVFIQRFTNRLNENEKQALFASLNIKLEHPILKTTQTKEKDLNALKTALKDENKLNQFNEDVWKYDIVSDILLMQINFVINKYK